MLWRSCLLGQGLILLETEVLAQLAPFRQRDAHSLEAGGILIGYRRDRHLHVVEATTPGTLDRRHRYGFERLDPSHEAAAHRRWIESRHKLDYVGEWHTHPQDHPLPSTIDRLEWGQILRGRRQPMVFAIVGLEDYWIGVGCRKTIEPARLIVDKECRHELVSASSSEADVRTIMTDKYKSFAELAANESADAYAIVAEDRGSQVTVAAPHGGAIEPGTSEIARAIAGTALSLYLFEGRKPDGNRDLHIASERFDEPEALRLLGGARLIVTVHGARGPEQVAYIGGRDKDTGERIRQALEEAGIQSAKHPNPWLQGEARENICNKGLSGAGVQLELSRGLRETFFESLGNRSKSRGGLTRFANAIRSVLTSG